MILLLVLILCAVWGAVVGKRRGRPIVGTILGFLLGFIGVGITALLPTTEKKLFHDEMEHQRIQAIAAAERKR